jgi:Chromo (CHRromatin Organisation MOdifier) domain
MTETSIDENGVGPQAKEGDVVVDATENDTENKSEEEEGGQYFEIEKIVAEEVSKEGQLFYIVRWLGYPPEEDTREPASELAHCVEIIAEWEAKKAERLKQKGISVLSSGCTHSF